jgi:hypothetical protein
VVIHVLRVQQIYAKEDRQIRGQIDFLVPHLGRPKRIGGQWVDGRPAL